MKVSKKRLGWLLIVAILTIVGGELFARYYFGLGTPPLSMVEPKIGSGLIQNVLMFQVVAMQEELDGDFVHFGAF